MIILTNYRLKWLKEVQLSIITQWHQDFFFQILINLFNLELQLHFKTLIDLSGFSKREWGNLLHAHLQNLRLRWKQLSGLQG